MSDKKWIDGSVVNESEHYVRLMEPLERECRGDRKRFLAGHVFKVLTHERALHLEDGLRWQKYPYASFVPATEQEFETFHLL